jgi:hypothetical protein
MNRGISELSKVRVRGPPAGFAPLVSAEAREYGYTPLFRRTPEGNEKCLSPTITQLQGQMSDHEHKSWSPGTRPDNFTIFEGTSGI